MPGDFADGPPVEGQKKTPRAIVWFFVVVMLFFASLVLGMQAYMRLGAVKPQQSGQDNQTDVQPYAPQATSEQLPDARELIFYNKNEYFDEEDNAYIHQVRINGLKLVEMRQVEPEQVEILLTDAANESVKFAVAARVSVVADQKLDVPVAELGEIFKPGDEVRLLVSYVPTGSSLSNQSLVKYMDELGNDQDADKWKRYYGAFGDVKLTEAEVGSALAGQAVDLDNSAYILDSINHKDI